VPKVIRRHQQASSPQGMSVQEEMIDTVGNSIGLATLAATGTGMRL
jgi:hypothetical protein